MTNLFTYGSLMFEPVWSMVVGEKRESVAARAFGVERLAVANALYPGMIKTGGKETVDGVVYFHLTAADILLLDRFEGALYERIPIECELAEGRVVSADCYFFKDEYRYLLDDKPWDVRRFEREGIHAFLGRKGMRRG